MTFGFFFRALLNNSFVVHLCSDFFVWLSLLVPLRLARFNFLRTSQVTVESICTSSTFPASCLWGQLCQLDQLSVLHPYCFGHLSNILLSSCKDFIIPQFLLLPLWILTLTGVSSALDTSTLRTSYGELIRHEKTEKTTLKYNITSRSGYHSW